MSSQTGFRVRNSRLWLPGYYARRHKDDQAKKSMLRLYGTVDNYDVNHEFEVLRQNVAAYEALHRVQKKASFLEIFKGVNGCVRPLSV